MAKSRIGLLPLYLELYDRALPQCREAAEAFYARIAGELEARGLQVLTAPVCRVEPEFEQAVRSFEDSKAEAIVTLHLAYSPSLESAEALAAAALPIIVLDTTPTYSFGPAQEPGEIMFNHGIHGVQDMCNLLIRNGKWFAVEAGHWERSDVLDRVAQWARAASLAAHMRSARVGLIGEPFRGMGDFSLPADVMRGAIGIETVPCDPVAIHRLLPDRDAPDVAAEMAGDAQAFTVEDVAAESHRETTRACLAVRRWIAQEALSAFSFNFLNVDRACGIPTAPFLEASKAMARGIGYAGEGDVLTAALVGALASVFPETTFTEMFCPDWEGGRVFLSHMGEMNVALAAPRPLLTTKPFPWTDAADPVVATGCLRGGEAVFVNLAPGSKETFSLILAPASMLDAGAGGSMADSVRGWFEPAMPLSDFLAEYSYAGGTHHAALVYGDVVEDLARFGEIMGWQVIILD